MSPDFPRPASYDPKELNAYASSPTRILVFEVAVPKGTPSVASSSQTPNVMLVNHGLSGLSGPREDAILAHFDGQDRDTVQHC
jgi:hypothetical protein